MQLNDLIKYFNNLTKKKENKENLDLDFSNVKMALFSEDNGGISLILQNMITHKRIKLQIIPNGTISCMFIDKTISHCCVKCYKDIVKIITWII